VFLWNEYATLQPCLHIVLRGLYTVPKRTRCNGSRIWRRQRSIGDAGVTFFVWCTKASGGVDVVGAADGVVGEVVQACVTCGEEELGWWDCLGC
jgi:hypothetical protein